MSEARGAILDRIRAAKGASSTASAAETYAQISRTYLHGGDRDREGIVDLMEERLREYDAGVFRVAHDEAGAIVARLLQARGLSRVLVPAGLPTEWMRGCEFVVDAAFNAGELDSFDGVLTTATVGIAETGTIVLQNAPGQGRRAITLVPDYQMCVLRVDDLVETVVEAMGRLEKTKELATTFFSGPSATADIEMTRIKGVHGPRFVDVLLVS